MPLIALEGVRYRYPEAEGQALDGITTAVEPGQVILLRGPSGSGKSTLLRCLNGLVPQSTGGDFAGRVTVCGLDTRVHLPRELGARIGFVFQHPDAQFVLEDVEAELAFGLENLGLDRGVMRKRIEETIDQVGINALRHRRIATLSGGERQRVAIAAALAMHPQGLAAATPTNPPADGAGTVIARLDRLGYSYPSARAVEDVSLTLRRGQVTALMGRNGSGKTTLLRLIGGTLRPQRGRLHSEGRVAYVPQDADALLFAATVRDELRGQPEEVTAPFQAWLLRYPRDLSAGERQQLAIAVVAGQADLLLLDEPTRGLDPVVKKALTNFLRLRASSGAAMLIATHDVEWAARTANRVLLMADGEIYADGPPRTVLSDSLVFATQINKLLGHGWLLPEEVPV